MNRRTFVKSAAVLALIKDIDMANAAIPMEKANKNIRVISTDSNFKREELASPFGFKGGYLTELWQAAVKMNSESGNSSLGIATQSVLYGEADLFASISEAGGNALMFGLTNKALQVVKKTSFYNPIELLDKVLPEVWEEGRRITGKEDLNVNFVYNALVSIDNAAWLLYAADNGLTRFDDMIPAPYKPAVSYQNEKVAVMYAVSYGMHMEELRKGVDEGYFIFKIKTGQAGTQADMLEKDKARLGQIHNELKDVRTSQTPNGKVLYTMDANGRYEKKETLLRYLDHAKKIGAFDQILLYEEPLAESNDEFVTDVGVRLAADESIHDEHDANRRLEQGYDALVLKGIAKTLSLSLKMAQLAHDRGVPCICADLTVNPILVDWHKNLAARLMPFPELGMGVMETNGAMNYKNWEAMTRNNPAHGAPWTSIQNGVFKLGKDFYQQSGGIFEPAPHYEKLFKKP